MHIDETTFPVQNAWSGELAQPQGQGTFAPTIKGLGSTLPQASLGKPDYIGK